MKLSPYFRVFEEEANTWEEKLNRINNLFDVWIDVQRRWVYLEGIFSGNADIANLLPVETSRFNSISAEFLTLMKKVGCVQTTKEYRPTTKEYRPDPFSFRLLYLMYMRPWWLG